MSILKEILIWLALRKEQRLWERYFKASKKLLEFYQHTDNEDEEIKYYDGSSLKDIKWEEDSNLSLIKKAYDSLTDNPYFKEERKSIIK